MFLNPLNVLLFWPKVTFLAFILWLIFKLRSIENPSKVFSTNLVHVLGMKTMHHCRAKSMLPLLSELSFSVEVMRILVLSALLEQNSSALLSLSESSSGFLLHVVADSGRRICSKRRKTCSLSTGKVLPPMYGTKQTAINVPLWCWQNGGHLCCRTWLNEQALQEKYWHLCSNTKERNNWEFKRCTAAVCVAEKTWTCWVRPDRFENGIIELSLSTAQLTRIALMSWAHPKHLRG